MNNKKSVTRREALKKIGILAAGATVGISGLSASRNISREGITHRIHKVSPKSFLSNFKGSTQSDTLSHILQFS